MRKILDILFEKKKLAFWLPISFAVVVYLLFLLFGSADDKKEFLISTPLVTAFWFFGSFLVVFFQVKNPGCPEWLLNFGELFFTVLFVGFSIVGVVSYVISGFQNFSPVMCAGIVTYSSVSWAHNKRAKTYD